MLLCCTVGRASPSFTPAAAAAAAAAAVSAIIAHESSSEAVHLIGHSYGGAIALQMMLDRPQRFASLTLIEAAPYPLLAEAGETDLAA